MRTRELCKTYISTDAEEKNYAIVQLVVHEVFSICNSEQVCVMFYHQHDCVLHGIKHRLNGYQAFTKNMAEHPNPSRLLNITECEREHARNIPVAERKPL